MNSKKEGKKESEKNKLKRMISYTFFFFFYENDNTPFSMFHMHMSKISELTSRKIDLFLYNAFKKKKKSYARQSCHLFLSNQISPLD